MMSEEVVISGTIIYGDEFEIKEGYLCIRDYVITEVGDDTGVDAQINGLVAPCFVNAHTHIGDSVLKDPPVSDLDALVRPPHGLKHRILDKTSRDDIEEAMRQTLTDMVSTGTGAFCDFREGGIPGASMLIDILDTFHHITGVVMGRPKMQDKPASTELEELLDICNGIGISGVNDVPLDVLEAAAKSAHDAGRLFALHAGEKDTSDINTALELTADFIVHMTHASHEHIKRMVEEDMPVVVCPRSNWVTGVGSPDHPPVGKMLDSGLRVGVGTDNVMLNSVNIFSEMEFLSKIYGLDDRQVFKMCTLNGANILGLEDKIGSIVEGKQSSLMVLDEQSSNLSNSSDLLASLVRRGRPDDIKSIIR